MLRWPSPDQGGSLEMPSEECAAISVTDEDLQRHISRLEVKGLSAGWIKCTEMWLRNFLDAVDWRINEEDVLRRLNQIQGEIGRSTYRKKFFQIRKFCQRLGADWADKLEAPPARDNIDISVYRPGDIQAAYDILSGLYTRRYSALLLLGATSGMRAHEMYHLRREDIDLDERIVTVLRSKTGRSRHAFFSERARDELAAYFDEEREFKRPFCYHAVQNQFKKTALKVKHLRKFFSQEWDRHGGNYNIKQLIMGRSVNGNIDLKHYAAQGIDDLRAEYDRVDVTVF